MKFTLAISEGLLVFFTFLLFLVYFILYFNSFSYISIVLLYDTDLYRQSN
jgi:hypothetical protein